MAEYEAVCFYDMWGVDFSPAPEEYQQSIAALLESGKGLMLMNHALVEWPAWPAGATSAAPPPAARGRGLRRDDSRLRLPGGGADPRGNGRGKVTPDPAAAGHPVVEGIEDGFVVQDELYLTSKNFESQPDILPLMRTDYPMVQENFNPPPMAAQEEKDRWSHPEGSDLVVWAKKSGNSPVVATHLGDGPAPTRAKASAGSSTTPCTGWPRRKRAPGPPASER